MEKLLLAGTGLKTLLDGTGGHRCRIGTIADCRRALGILPARPLPDRRILAGWVCRHSADFAYSPRARRAAATNARTFSGSFEPGDRSTPLAVSTAPTPVIRIASATLPG